MKIAFGATAFGLVHCVFELYGGAIAGRLLTSLGRLFTSFLQLHGFTCGIEHLLLTREADAARHDVLLAATPSAVAAAAEFAGLKVDLAVAGQSADDNAFVTLVARQLRRRLQVHSF